MSTPLSQFTLDPHNANRHTDRGLRALRASIRAYGTGRSIVVDRNNRVIAGEATLQTAQALGVDGAVIVETTGDQLVVVRRKDLDLTNDPDHKARLLSIADNRVAELDLNFDYERLAAIDQVIGLSELFNEDELYDTVEETIPDAPAALDSYSPDVQPHIERTDVPDAIFPSDNEYDIPILDLAMQADYIDQPVYVWGTEGRRTIRKKGTYVFYTRDNRFTALKANPQTVVNSGVPTAVEANFTTTPQTPRVLALGDIYWKRWIARYWQSRGVRILVDLNVASRFYQDNFIGVPPGWSAFATHGYAGRLDDLAHEYSLAQSWSGKNNPLFLVYGGGQAVKAWCQGKEVIWIPEEIDVKAGRPIVS